MSVAVAVSCAVVVAVAVAVSVADAVSVAVAVAVSVAVAVGVDSLHNLIFIARIFVPGVPPKESPIFFNSQPSFCFLFSHFLIIPLFLF